MSVQYSQLRFLIVDDFDSFRKSLNEMILGIGANNVDLARDGKDAIKMCTIKPYDIILMDFNLGKGKNGQQILEELHAFKLIKHSTVFIMTTAEVNKEMVLSALEHQPDAYLAKPFSLAELKNRLDIALSRNKQLEDILSALDNQNHPEAIELCDKHINSKDSASLWCYKIKADLLYKIGDYEKAKAIYQPAVDNRQPNWALLGLGKTLTATREFSKSTQYLMQLIKKNPLSLEAHDALADNYQKCGDIDLAQETLRRALQISSRSVPRQQAYANICIQNEDLEVASNALRKTIELSNNSIHQGADNGLRFARCLTLHAAELEEKEAKAVLSEALSTLTTLTKEFDQPITKVRSKLVEACVHYTIHNEDKSNAAIEEASILNDTLELENPAAILLEFAETYSQINNQKKAKEILSVLQEKYADDAVIAAAIDVLLDNPVSQEGKDNIKGINQRGINHYENKEYTAAIEEFSMALTRYPKHAGIQLNLMQAALAVLEEGNNIKYLKKCRVIMKKLNRMSEKNEQYPRFQKLKTKYEDITFNLSLKNSASNAD